MATSSQPLGGGAGGVFDYLTGADEDACGVSPEYYGEASAAWGKGAERLGVESIGRELFIALAEGRGPDGIPLVQTQNGKHVAGIDVTFSVPKSVSALLITATPDERRAITDAWMASVHTAFDRMEATAKVGRRTIPKPAGTDDGTGKGTTTERVTADLIGFIAQHETARPTLETDARGSGADPHLHVHAFVFNLAWIQDPRKSEGGRWGAIDDYGIKTQAEAREAHVQADFALRLEGLGYKLRWSQDKRGYDRFEIDGIEDEVIQHFSTNARRAKVTAQRFEEKHFKPPTEPELRREMRNSRKAKDHDHGGAPDWEGLDASAQAAGIHVPRITPEPLRRASVAVAAKRREKTLRERLEGAGGLTRDNAVFDRDSVATVMARCALGLGLTLDELDAFAEQYAAEELVLVRRGLKSDQFDLLTTKANLRNEQTVASILEAKAAGVLPSPTLDAIERAVERLMAEGVALDDEQLAAVEAACGHAGLTIIEGLAGSGKTTMLKAVLYAYRDRRSTGRSTTDAVLSISVAALTAQRTGRKLDADASFSVEAFLEAVAKGKIKPTDRTLIVLDEAVMADTIRMASLLRAARPARLILVGDPKQLQCIGGGGWYADAVEKWGRVLLTKVHRQRNSEDVDALSLLRNGSPEAALKSFESRGRLHTADNRAERIGSLIGDYRAHRDQGLAVGDVKIVVDGSNSEVDQLNRLAQLDRLHRGELVGPGIEVQSLAEDRSWKLYQGDEVLFLKPYFDGSTSVRNGTVGRIVGIKANLVTVNLTEDQRTITIPVTELADRQHIGLAYAMHATKMQGHEAEVILVAPGKATTTLESAYSALSRCREAVHLYLDHETHGDDPVAFLARSWRTADPKTSATAMLKGEGIDYDIQPPDRLLPEYDLGPDGHEDELRRKTQQAGTAIPHQRRKLSEGIGIGLR